MTPEHSVGLSYSFIPRSLAASFHLLWVCHACPAASPSITDKGGREGVGPIMIRSAEPQGPLARSLQTVESLPNDMRMNNLTKVFSNKGTYCNSRICCRCIICQATREHLRHATLVANSSTRKRPLSKWGHHVTSLPFLKEEVSSD